MSFADADISAGNLFSNRDGRKAFRCDHIYDDGSCYGGSDGGGCSKRKKREETTTKGRQPVIEQGQNSSRSSRAREKRQTDDVIGCQKESTNGVDYRGRAAETVDGVPCVKWTEGYGGALAELGDHNFCRNPLDINDPNGVWCTTSPDLVESSINYCNVPKCDPVVTTRDVSCADWYDGRAYWKWEYTIPDNCYSEFETHRL